MSFFGGTPVTVFSRVTTLTDTQIKTLPTTAVELVPAPGEGKIIIPVYAVAQADFTAGAYTIPGDASWQLMLGIVEWSTPALVGSLNGAAVNRLVQINSAFLADGSGAFSGVVITGVVSGLSVADLTNIPLSLKDDYNGVVNYTDGNAANSLRVTVVYTVIDVA